MSTTAKAIAEYGVLIVIAGTFLVIVVQAFRWGMQQVECMKDSHNKAVEAFVETANAFNQTVINHIVHSDESYKELTHAIERLCIYIEAGQKHGREGTD